MNRWDGYTYTYQYDGELYHHGILGQKWGIRRYQNEDGSLTEEGRKRYGRDESSINKNQFQAYQDETLRKAQRDANKELKSTKEYKKAAVVAGLNRGVGMASAIGAGLALMPVSRALSVGASIGLTTTGNAIADQIIENGKNEASKILGYSGYADMVVSKYDDYAKKAGMPSMKQTSWQIREFMTNSSAYYMGKKLEDDVVKTNGDRSFTEAYMDWIGTDENIAKSDSYKEWRKKIQ